MRAPGLCIVPIVGLALLLADGAALAQIAHHPFAIGAGEGAVGHQNALGAWILGQESRFYLQLTHAVRATHESSAAALGLIGLSFAYGIFHAAGPGHGKAVITSYMVSNEVALRRGLAIAFLAALLQGLVAVAIVGIAACLFNATAPTMTAASQAIELTSYLGIVALGLLLVWRKGRAFWTALPARGHVRPPPLFAEPTPLAMATAGPSLRVGLDGSLASRAPSRFRADDGTAGHVHGAGCECGHAHIPDPAQFATERFDWRAAGIAIVTAGARPCSGAILVLVFALSQGIFVAGVAATFAMSVGTALTTGALAIAAVFAKDLAMRASGVNLPRAALIGRGVELAAAACVLLFGIALLAAALSGIHTAA